MRTGAAGERQDLLAVLKHNGRQWAQKMEASILQHSPGGHSPGAVHLREPVFVTDPLDEQYGGVRDWDLSDSDLQQLPECFCELTVQRNLDLSDNPMESLPTNFGSLRIGGNLKLAENLLEVLPASWGGLQVGGSSHPPPIRHSCHSCLLPESPQLWWRDALGQLNPHLLNPDVLC